MRDVLRIVLAATALLAGGCGGGGTPAGGGPTSASATTAPAPPASEEGASPTEAESAPAGGAALHVVTTDLGDVLADADGHTLYVFLPDDRGPSTCYEDCEQNWPPLLGPAEAGAGVRAARVATAEREDGSQQVTYNDWPLYYFAGDEQPGDLNGQGVGGVWFVINTRGEPVQPPAANDDGGADDY